MRPNPRSVGEMKIDVDSTRLAQVPDTSHHLVVRSSSINAMSSYLCETQATVDTSGTPWLTIVTGVWLTKFIFNSKGATLLCC